MFSMYRKHHQNHGTLWAKLLSTVWNNHLRLEKELNKLCPHCRTIFSSLTRCNCGACNRCGCWRSKNGKKNGLQFLRVAHGFERGKRTFTATRSPLSSTHLKNLPPKNWTPMIEKISQNTRQTSRTLKIDGIAYIRALTTIYNGRRQ